MIHRTEYHRFLVTGATGTIGREVVKALLENRKKVRVLTRNPQKLENNEMVEVIKGDLTQPKTLKTALEDVDGIHLISFGDENYTPLSTGKSIVDLAMKAGVKRATVLWNGEGNESTIEREIKNSPFDWTILQPQEYMANALGWTQSIIETNVVKEPFGDRPTAAIHESDVGAAIAHILMYGGHAQKTYTLTGPAVLTPKRQVLEIGKAIGREIKFTELNEEQTRERWRTWGLPKETMDYLYEWYDNTPPEGYTVTTTVEDIIGRPAYSFQKWVSDNIQHFRPI